jgi:Spy/CpxP family protein refolding chaperone
VEPGFTRLCKDKERSTMHSTLRAIALSVFTLTLTAAPRAWAMPNGELGEHWTPRLRALIKYANLTPDQQTQVRAILDKAEPQRKSLWHQEATFREQMAEKMLGSGPVTSADFSPLIQQDAQVHQQLVGLVLDVSVQIRNLLTPAQLAHVSQLHEQVKTLNKQKRALLHDAAQDEEDGQ